MIQIEMETICRRRLEGDDEKGSILEKLFNERGERETTTGSLDIFGRVSVPVIR